MPLNPRQFFHATDLDLQPGDEVHPPARTGVSSRFEGYPAYRGDRVYMFTHKDYAEQYGPNYGKNTYEVEPLGDVERDPEYSLERHKIRRLPRGERAEAHGYNDMAANARTAPAARVLRKMR